MFGLLITVICCINCYIIFIKRQTEIVISRYNEPIDYLNHWSFYWFKKITIYNKGPELHANLLPKHIEIIPLANVGREVHSYLHHILNHYNHLASYTIFIPASYTKNPEKQNAANIMFKDYVWSKNFFLGYPIESKEDLLHLHEFKISDYITTDENNKLLNPETKLSLSPERPFKEWFKKNFSDDTEINFVTLKGIFSVKKEEILKHDLEYYKKFIAYVDKSPNPEAGHYIERSWHAIFLNEASKKA
jgi:hypothetical protein